MIKIQYIKWRKPAQLYSQLHDFLWSVYTVACWLVNSVLYILRNQCNCISFCANVYLDIMTTLYPLLHYADITCLYSNVLLMDTIVKPQESGELCEEITESVVVGDRLSQQGEGDLPPPQMKWSTHTAHQMKVVLFLYLIKERPIVGQNPKECCIYYELNQFPLPVFSPTPFQPPTLHCGCIDNKIRMHAWLTFQVFVANTFDNQLLIHSYLNSPYIFVAIICSFMCIF